MGVGLSSMQAIGGSIGAAALAAAKISGDMKKEGELKKPNAKDSGIDMKMAAKARKEAQAKINAIYANKEISNKAKTRRMGKVMDEYNKQIGGKK